MRVGGQRARPSARRRPPALRGPRRSRRRPRRRGASRPRRCRRRPRRPPRHRTRGRWSSRRAPGQHSRAQATARRARRHRPKGRAARGSIPSDDAGSDLVSNLCVIRCERSASTPGRAASWPRWWWRARTRPRGCCGGRRPRASAAATSRGPRAGRRRTARRSCGSASAPRRSATKLATTSPEDRGVDEQAGRPRIAAWPRMTRDHRDVHRVAQVAVHAADHELLGRRGRRTACRGPRPRSGSPCARGRRRPAASSAAPTSLRRAARPRSPTRR